MRVTLDSRLNGGVTQPGFSTKLDNIDEHGEGEVCMNGSHVFMGYLNEPEKTAETIDKDGWLHSGDIGQIDSKGNVLITGKRLFIFVRLPHSHMSRRLILMKSKRMCFCTFVFSQIAQ